MKIAKIQKDLDDGPLTVFAPNNTAFEELGADALHDILSDKKLLEDILSYHTINDVVKAGDLICNGITPMGNNQDSATICEGGKIYQKGKKNYANDMPEIIQTDIETCQGVIHVVGKNRLRFGF